ncbi:glycosyltransferase family 2 protein [Candidatus Dependentiae bacterium]|nr:glycosyltransferase family 2 protein [Candidatus Dependentiae bacterium]
MNKISVVIITKNEESRILKTLKSVNWCDEIIVVDSGSEDNTVKICKDFGCKVFYNKFFGYGEQKQFAVSKTANDWIFSIDADEVVTEKLKNEIIKNIDEYSSSYNGFTVKSSLIFFDKKLKWGGSCIKCKLRVFNKKYGNFNSNKVHESVIVTGRVKHLKNEILHYSYQDIFDYFEKFNIYTEYGAEELFAKNKKSPVIKIIFRTPLEFFKRYILQLGLLDGYPGFVWSFLCSFYPTVKYIKLRELHKKQKKLNLDLK